MADEEVKETTEASGASEARPDPKSKGKESKAKAGKKKGIPKIAVIGLLILVLAGGGFVASKKLMGGKEKAPEALKEGKIVALDEFLVNLADGGTFFKCQISLGIVEGAPEKLVEEHMAAVRDTIIMILTAKQPEEIGTPEGKLKLKRELLDGLNRLLGEKTGQGHADNTHGKHPPDGGEAPGGDAASGEAGGKRDGGEHAGPGPVMNIYFTAFATS
ncbi:MAG: flagellar basal body-associated FliL family protein [Fimbriimonadia bacterium]|jgi:flagellar FliL protein